MEELLELALEAPERGAARAREVLAAAPDDLARSYAHQCLGIVLRDQGRTDEAVAELRRGLRAAAASGTADRERDVRATYGATLVFAGRTRTGLRQLERAGDGATGRVGGQVLMRHAASLVVLGRNRDAVPVLEDAARALAAAGDRVWEARSRSWLSHAHLVLGEMDRADAEARFAEQAFAAAGLHGGRLIALTSRVEIAASRSDLATALRLGGEVLDGYREHGQPPTADVVIALAEVWLRAGLADEAVALLEEQGGHSDPPPHLVADLDLARATALLAAGRPDEALTTAREARDRYRRQQRDWFTLRARLATVRAADRLGRRRGLAEEAAEVAAALHAEGAREAPAALVLAARHRPEEAGALLGSAASYRDRPDALVRAGAWHGRALQHELDRDRGGVLRACAAGLAAIDEHRRLVGSSELRALAGVHGRELAALALRHAADSPRSLLRWSERTRATALAQPAATAASASIPAALAALRETDRQLAEARADGEPTTELERERERWERAVRAEHRTLAPRREARQQPVAVEDVVAGVGAGCLVELVDVDGTLHVLVVHRGRVRRRVAGPTAAALELLAPAGMLLRRAASGRPVDLAGLGSRLEAALLGPAAALVPAEVDGPVVVAPPARLHGLAWALLPTLRDRPFVVVPSAGQWLRARAAGRPGTGRRRTVLVAGPGLATGGAEVPLLAERHPDAALLEGGAAEVDAVLGALDGADLVHLAAHGRFRRDSPLFSALQLADGALTVHDLERLHRAPYRVVLSACESGVLAPVGGEELLGLAAALFSLGTAGLVAAVAEVNDEATAALMVGLHEALAGGASPAEALHAARRAAGDDVVAAGTAAAFVAMGA